MEKEIRVLVKEPGKAAEIREIEDYTLEALQGIVGGYIEAVTIASDCVMLVNEEGKLRRLPVNFPFFGDVIAGTAVFLGVDGENFGSLQPETERSMRVLFPVLFEEAKL